MNSSIRPYGQRDKGECTESQSANTVRGSVDAADMDDEAESLGLEDCEPLGLVAKSFLLTLRLSESSRSRKI